MSTTGSTQGGSKAAKSEIVTTKSLKLATPTVFTGDRKKLDTFLLQLNLYFKFNRSSFATDADRVQYAAYYLQGEAEEWFRPYLQEYTDNEDDLSQAEESTRRMFASFTRFKSEIRMMFGDIDRERTAERDLLKLRQTKSAADYTAHFTRLSAATNWEDAALTAIFYAGLKDGVKDEIARGERPDNLRAMTIMAIRIDNRLYERRKEKGQPTYGDERKIATYTSGRKRNKNRHQKNDKYGPKPMDIDVIEPKKRTFDGDCYNCGKKGHLARDCRGPQRTKKSNKARGSNRVTHDWMNQCEQICTMGEDDLAPDYGSELSPSDRETLEIAAQNWYLRRHERERDQRAEDLIARQLYRITDSTAMRHCPLHADLREYVRSVDGEVDRSWGTEQLAVARGLRKEIGRVVAYLMLRVDYPGIGREIQDLLRYIQTNPTREGLHNQQQRTMTRVREILERDLPTRTDEPEANGSGNDEAS